MNKELSRLLAIALAAAMIFGFLPAARFVANAVPLNNGGATPPVNTVAAPCMFLVGPNGLGLQTWYTNTTIAGTMFTVYGWVNATVDEGGWTGAFLFNSTQLKVLSFAWPANNSAQSYWSYDNGQYYPAGVYPFTVNAIPPVLNNSDPTNSPLLGGSIGEPNGFGEAINSPGVIAATSPSEEYLFSITFQFLAGAIPIAGVITGSINWDPSWGIFTTTGGGNDYPTLGNFNYIVAVPPPPPPAEPSVAVVNETSTTFATLAGPSGYDLTNEVGTMFVEDVYINNYDSRLNLNSVNVEVDYSNTTLLAINNEVFGADWTGFAINNIGSVTFSATNTTIIPTGNELFAKITFQILTQETIPPYSFGYFDSSQVTVNSTATALANATGSITFLTTNAPEVDVYAYLSVIPAYFEVTPALTVEGPEPCVGNTFVVNVTLVPGKSNNIIGAQFVLQYNSTLIKPISVAEGPDFPNAATASANGETTYPSAVIDSNIGTWGPNVLFSDIILPNLNTGLWAPPTADNTSVIAEITFQVMYQPPTGFITSPLAILNDPSNMFVVGLSDMVNQNIVYPNMLAPVNALYEVTTPAWQTGRMIDEYGGAVNSGHGYLATGTDSPFPVTEGNDWAFPAPYGGQGPNMPMDMVEPQSFVYFNAYVSYNGWPVQNKNVAFEITEPDSTLYMKTSAFTDSDGIATIGFRMPWPCDPNQCAALLGKWNEVSTVELADVVINDTLNFKYDYIIHIDNVAVEPSPSYLSGNYPTYGPLDFNHGDTVTIDFNFSSYFMQQMPISLPFPVLIEVSIVDNLGVTVGTSTYTTTVGGAVFCTYYPYIGQVQIPIPKWAYAGIATINVAAFDGLEPVAGGVPITPLYVGPTIAIEPT